MGGRRRRLATCCTQAPDGKNCKTKQGFPRAGSSDTRPTQLPVALCHRAGQRCQGFACTWALPAVSSAQQLIWHWGNYGGRAGPLGLLGPLDLTGFA